MADVAKVVSALAKPSSSSHSSIGWPGRTSTRWFSSGRCEFRVYSSQKLATSVIEKSASPWLRFRRSAAIDDALAGARAGGRPPGAGGGGRARGGGGGG